MMRLRKNDQVLVIAGKDRGKKGRVMKIYAAEHRVLVEKINYYKKALRKSKANPKGGIAQVEGKLDISNVKLVCPRCSKASRVGFTILADGTKQRSCRRCHEIIGS